MSPVFFAVTSQIGIHQLAYSHTLLSHMSRAAEALVLDAAQASVSLHFRRKRSAEGASNGAQWRTLSLRVFPDVGLTVPERHNSRNGTASAGPASVSTRFVEVDMSDLDDNATRTERMARKAVCIFVKCKSICEAGPISHR